MRMKKRFKKGELSQEFKGSLKRAFTLTQGEKKKLKRYPSKIGKKAKEAGKRIDFGNLIGQPFRTAIKKKKRKKPKYKFIKVKVS